MGYDSSAAFVGITTITACIKNIYGIYWPQLADTQTFVPGFIILS
jgi:hypothetical protein